MFGIRIVHFRCKQLASSLFVLVEYWFVRFKLGSTDNGTRFWSLMTSFSEASFRSARVVGLLCRQVLSESYLYRLFFLSFSTKFFFPVFLSLCTFFLSFSAKLFFPVFFSFCGLQPGLSLNTTQLRI
jgi:hypothetical protein